jgi:hypothetical protein
VLRDTHFVIDADRFINSGFSHLRQTDLTDDSIQEGVGLSRRNIFCISLRVTFYCAYLYEVERYHDYQNRWKWVGGPIRRSPPCLRLMFVQLLLWLLTVGILWLSVVLSYAVPGELIIHERNQLLSLVTELPLHYSLRL